MINLDDQSLIDAYNNAVELNLDIDFIEMLEKEIQSRNLLGIKKKYLYIK